MANGFMIWTKDAKLFFIKTIYKNHCVALATELFFKEVLVKKGEHIRQNYISIWHLTQLIANKFCNKKSYNFINTITNTINGK